MRLVADAATPVRKLARVAAVLGPREVTLAVVGERSKRRGLARWA